MYIILYICSRIEFVGELKYFAVLYCIDYVRHCTKTKNGFPLLSSYFDMKPWI